MQPDSELAQIVDDLLRTDPRLVAAAPLLGRVAVLVSEVKPERPRKARGPKRLPPLRAVGTPDAPVMCEPEAEEDEAPKPAAAPWLKIVRVKIVSDATRAREGDRCLVELVVNGGLAAKLRSEDLRRALALALRCLRHEEREDGSSVVKREPPPLQCHPDTADDLSHLVAALGVDGAEGAATVSAAERLATGSVDTRPLEDKVRDLLRAWHSGVDDLSDQIVALDAAMRDDEDHDSDFPVRPAAWLSDKEDQGPRWIIHDENEGQA